MKSERGMARDKARSQHEADGSPPCRLLVYVYATPVRLNMPLISEYVSLHLDPVESHRMLAHASNVTFHFGLSSSWLSRSILSGVSWVTFPIALTRHVQGVYVTHTDIG